MIRQLIFFPEKTHYEKPRDYGFDAEDVEISLPGAKLHGWFLKAPDEKAVLYFLHGNAGNISHRLYKAKGWVERNISVFLLDYRGYGKSSGEINEGEDIVRDAEAGLDFLKSRGYTMQQIIFYGESLGTYAMVRLSERHKAAAVVLEAPFTSFVDIGRIHYPQAPSFLLKGFEFASADHIANIKPPMFILHGTLDEICPYEMAGELMEKAPEPKALFTIPNGAHNDLPNTAGDDYWEKPYEFVTKYLKP